MRKPKWRVRHYFCLRSPTVFAKPRKIVQAMYTVLQIHNSKTYFSLLPELEEIIVGIVHSLFWWIYVLLDYSSGQPGQSNLSQMFRNHVQDSWSSSAQNVLLDYDHYFVKVLSQRFIDQCGSRPKITLDGILHRKVFSCSSLMSNFHCSSHSRVHILNTILYLKIKWQLHVIDVTNCFKSTLYDFCTQVIFWYEGTHKCSQTSRSIDNVRSSTLYLSNCLYKHIRAQLYTVYQEHY